MTLTFVHPKQQAKLQDMSSLVGYPKTIIQSNAYTWSIIPCTFHIVIGCWSRTLCSLCKCHKEAKIIFLIPKEPGHTQPSTPFPCHISMANWIAMTLSKQCSRSMKMQYFWIADQVTQKQFTHPSQTKLSPHGKCPILSPYSHCF